MKELPADFIKQAKLLFGNTYNEFANSICNDKITSIRINDKTNQAIDLEKVKWCNNGYYLSNRPNFTLDPFLHAGAYYVQEASSMFLEQFLTQYVATDAIVLDMCAAPGGKSSMLSQHLKNGLLVSNEFVKSRASILIENLTKWGNDNCVVTNNAPIAFEKYRAFFDAVLVDAPCSGEGMFRKDDTAITEWSLQNVQQCAARQQDILKSAWKTLKTDGILIYSTCTYNRQENEENVEWLLNTYDAELLTVETRSEWGITPTEGGYHFYPHKAKGEGLFMTAIRKLDDDSPSKIKMAPTQNGVGKPSLECLQNAQYYVTVLYRNLWYAIPKNKEIFIKQLLQNLNVIYFGILIYERKGKDFIPQAALALSKQLNRECYPSVTLSLEDSLRFLRSETICIDAPKGFCAVTYQGIPLGWVKNLGNRCNNLYPNSWRIRMAINAQEIPQPFLVKKK